MARVQLAKALFDRRKFLGMEQRGTRDAQQIGGTACPHQVHECVVREYDLAFLVDEGRVGRALGELAEAQLAVAQSGFRALALGDIPDVRAEDRPVRQMDGNYGELHRELAAILAHGGDFDALAQDRALPGRLKMPQAAPVGLAQGGGHDQFGKFPAQRFLSCVTKSCFRCRIEIDHMAFAVDRHDAVERRVDDRALEAFDFP